MSFDLPFWARSVYESVIGMDLVRVLIADDSFFMRTVLSDALSSCESLVVSGTAKNGREAAEKVLTLRPDVVTMDLDMPEVDGLEAIQKIMDVRPTPIIVVSAHALEGADITIKALELGAVDFVVKPQMGAGATWAPDRTVLIEKILAAARADVPRQGFNAWPPRQSVARKEEIWFGGEDVLVAIGASAGGPKALVEIFSALPRTLKSPMAIVQHMPAGFTGSFARRLNSLGSILVREAAEGDRFIPGVALVAPGGKHMEMQNDDFGPQVKISQAEPVHGVKPSVDVFLTSAVSHFPGSILSVILTGMGKDGAEGARFVHERGGRVLAQDEATSVIYGMPKSAVDTGCVDRLVSLPDMAREIVNEVAAMRDRGVAVGHHHAC